jgi:hypothetical protein
MEYVDRVSALQKDVQVKKDKAALAEARKFFESETIEDVTLLKDKVAVLMTAVNVIRPNIPATRGIATAMQYMLSAESLTAVTAPAASRVFHTAVALHFPEVFDVLLFWLWRVVELAPTMDAATVATFLNAYGRAGVRHPALYTALIARALEVMRNPAPPLTHVANVLHALSRVKMADPALLRMLAEHAVTRKGETTPIITATILDAAAQLDYKEELLFAPFEATAVAQAAECTPALLSSISFSVASAGRKTSPIFPCFADKAQAQAKSFDPASLSRFLDAYRLADCRHEDCFGALAEQACRVIPEFRLEEIRKTVAALAYFDLYDAELFPFLASRVVGITRGKAFFDFQDIATVLRSFAKLNERNDEFVAALTPVIKINLEKLTPEVLVDLLWSFATFGIRSELVIQLRRTLEGKALSEEFKNTRQTDLDFISKALA